MSHMNNDGGDNFVGRYDPATATQNFVADMNAGLAHDMLADSEAPQHGVLPSGGEVAGTGNLFVQMVRVFRQNKVALFCVGLLVFIVLFCFVGPYLYSTNQTDLTAFLGDTCSAAPSWKHPLGTDASCFDMLGRMMIGGQASLTVGFLAAMLAVGVGVVYGVIAGYRGGALDAVMMRFIDVMLSIPGLFLILAVTTIFGRNRTLMILVIGLLGWFGTSRLLRAEALTLREREFAQAVRSMGGGSRRIVQHHIIPNSISTIATVATFAIGDAIFALAGLGFLGIGLMLPDTDWGSMLNASTDAIFLGYWWQVYPVAILFLALIISFNYIGDALRDAFEVRLRER